MSDSLQPQELQHTRLLCPSLSPWGCSNSCPLSRWCHPTISSSVTHFSSCPQSFPASGLFQISQLFASSGQSIGASSSASVLPMNIQGWFPLGWTGLISLPSKGLSSLLQHHSSKASIRDSMFKYQRFYGFLHSFVICKNGITQGVHSCKAIISWNWGAALRFPTIPTQISMYALCLALIGCLI